MKVLADQGIGPSESLGAWALAALASIGFLIARVPTIASLGRGFSSCGTGKSPDKHAMNSRIPRRHVVLRAYGSVNDDPDMEPKPFPQRPKSP